MYVKCPSPNMGCELCPHRGKHKFIKGKCDVDCDGHTCIPADTTMVRVGRMLGGFLYQCPNCKTIKNSGTTPPKCPECK